MTNDPIVPQPADHRRGFDLVRLLRRWIERDTHRRQMFVLAALDDHLLRDIGVTRDDVRRWG